MRLVYLLLFIGCSQKFIKGIDQDHKYLKSLYQKKIALVTNQSSLRLDGTHLVDYLYRESIKITKIFALEHGFRGQASAGEYFDNDVDIQTGIKVISLYGKKKAPSHEDLKDVDIIIYDVQDVGVRFFTYIASLGHIMQAIADTNIKLIIFDRPNPNNYVAGPVNEYKNFLAPYPIPIVYGLTVGELANMIKGEGWVKGKVNLEIIKMKNYQRNSKFKLNTFPSPNLRSLKAIHNYPSLALFEPTVMSVGRGTYNPFEHVGHPSLKSNYSFTPMKIEHMSKWPKHENRKCYGKKVNIGKRLDLSLFFKYKNKFKDFVSNKKFLQYLIGHKQTFEYMMNVKHSINIEKIWENDLKKYKELRKKYLIY
jgi:uncharacterized protein YbbC (DUF1343 family)